MGVSDTWIDNLYQVNIQVGQIMREGRHLQKGLGWIGLNWAGSEQVKSSRVGLEQLAKGKTPEYCVSYYFWGTVNFFKFRCLKFDNLFIVLLNK